MNPSHIAHPTHALDSGIGGAPPDPQMGPLKKKLLLCLHVAALGLGCHVRTFPSCGEQGLTLAAVHGLLIAAASLVAEHGF